MEEKKFLKIKKDVDLVMLYARFVFILEDADTVQIIRNENYALNVIAVLGMDYDGLVLLEEIGLWRTKPYLASQPRKPGAKQNGTDKRIYVPARRKYADLSIDQYELIAPIIFQFFQEIVDKQVRTWKHRVARLWSPCFFYTKRPRKLHFSWKLREWPRGLCFKVRKESFFARDVCWAELNSNNDVQRRLKGLANYIMLCLDEYQTDWKRKKEFNKLAGAKRILESQRCKAYFPAYLLSEVRSYLPSVQDGNLLLNEISSLIGWNGELSEEKRMSLDALPDPLSRLGDIQIRIVRRQGDFLTFEVFPKN